MRFQIRPDESPPERLRAAREAADYFGDSVRTVQTWVRRFEDEGLAELAEADRPGRPRRLTDKQLDVIQGVLRRSPREAGMRVNVWDGKTLFAFIQKRFGVMLQVRQCQRLFRQLGLRLRKPRPMIARADPDVQHGFKKAEATGARTVNSCFSLSSFQPIHRNSIALRGCGN